MVRRDFIFLMHYFQKQFTDPSNDKETVVRMIVNMMITINQTHTNFSPQLFWEGATNKELPIPTEFKTLFPQSKFEAVNA